MQDAAQLVGQQIGQYAVREFIARGGMADVYLAYDVELKRKVALKVLLPALAADAQFAQRFQREAQTVARLDHPNIVHVYTIGTTPNGLPYIAMQYIEGGSLRDKLAQLTEQGALTPVDQALKLLRQIADALRVAHDAGIIHRDLKPGNILLRQDGAPVLVDLGIAAVSGGPKLTQTGSLIGTPHYMSPEQVQSRPLDGRSDLYSLGVILYEMLAGKRPFEGEESIAILHKQVYEAPALLETLRPDLSPPILSLAHTCLQKEPENRYQSAGELLAAIDRALAGVTHARRAPAKTDVLPAAQGEAVNRRWRLALIPLVVVVGMALLYFGLNAVTGDDAAPPGETAVGNPAALDAESERAADVRIDSPKPTHTAQPTATAPAPTHSPAPTLTPSPEPTSTPTATPVIMVGDPIEIRPYCDKYGNSPVSIERDRPVTLVWTWNATQANLVQEHIETATYEILLDGRFISAQRRSEIEYFSKSNVYSVSWYADVGLLEVGEHLAERRLSWSRQISDGWDTYGPGGDIETESHFCVIIVR